VVNFATGCWTSDWPASCFPQPAMAGPRRLDQPSNRFEITIGRSLAICLHPVAAWRSSSQRKRLVLIGAYVGAGYLFTLVALLTLVAVRLLSS
jgi:hypothetical protein